MDRRAGFALIFAAAAVALHLLAASANRPMVQQLAASPMALPPAGHQQQQHQPAADDMAGERLPLVATHHLPAASCWPHMAALPWAGAGDDLGGEGEELVGERQWPSCGMDDDGISSSSSQDQEQVAVNRKGQGRTSTGSLQETSVPGANNEPAKTAGTVDEEAELPALVNPDEPWLKDHCVVERLDFSTGGRIYRHMLYRFDLCLSTWTAERTSSEHLVLCQEPNDATDHMPCGHVIVPLRGLEGDECALAFRADNLDLVAFANRRNKWHVFPQYEHLIPTATVLDFNNDYSDLLGREDAEAITRLPLGGTSFLQASSLISLYMKAPGNEDQYYIRQALGMMSIGIPEAKRFTPVRELIVSGWLEGTSLNETMANYLTRWSELSCAILVADKGDAWGSDKYSRSLIDLGIAHSKQEALDIVDVLRHPQDTEISDCP